MPTPSLSIPGEPDDAWELDPGDGSRRTVSGTQSGKGGECRPVPSDPSNCGQGLLVDPPAPPYALNSSGRSSPR